MNVLLIAAVALGDEIQRFGSYFGYAAIIGLGVLSLLYFAQAREVKRLREWAGRAPERDAEIAERVQSDAQRRVIAQPISTPTTPASVQPASPQTAAAQSADAARKAAAAAVMEKFQSPAASASPAAVTGSPAPGPAIGPAGSLTRATTGSPAPAAAPATPGEVAAPAPGSVEAAQASAADAAAEAPASDPPATASSSPSVPPGMSAGTAGALAAARQAATASSPSRSPTYANGAGGQDTHESDAARPEPIGSDGAPPDLPLRRPRTPSAAAAADEPRGRGRIAAIVAGAVALLAAGVVLVLVLTGGSDAPPANNQIGDATPPAVAPPPPPAPAALTKADRAAAPVTVLNGTTQTGLASAVARTIEKDGFTILATETNADQQIAKTSVSYATGNERAARAVAQIMKVPASAVRPIDANTSVAASPESKIVVIVGSDKSGAG